MAKALFSFLIGSKGILHSGIIENKSSKVRETKGL